MTKMYTYHVEDGQFTFDTTSPFLLGRERSIIDLSSPEDDFKTIAYILFIDGYHVECIGNIERDFPKTFDQHIRIKNNMKEMYAEAEREAEAYILLDTTLDENMQTQMIGIEM